MSHQHEHSASKKGKHKSYMSSFTDIDKKKRPEDSRPSCGVNWQLCFFKDDIHNHVKKCQLEKQKKGNL